MVMHRPDDRMDRALIRRIRIGWPAALACALALLAPHASRAGDWALCAPSTLPPPPPTDLETSTIEGDSASLRDDGRIGGRGQRGPAHPRADHHFGADGVRPAGQSGGGARAGRDPGTGRVPRRQPPRGGLRDRRAGARGRDVQPPGLARPGRREADRERSPAHGHHRRLVPPPATPGRTRGGWRRNRSSSITSPAPARRATLSSASSAFPSCTHRGSRSPSTATASRDFSPPLSNRRDNTGSSLTLPYYLNLAPNYDATLRPRLTSRRGEVLGGEFRFPHRGGRRNDRGGSRAQRPDHRRLPVARLVPTPVRVNPGDSRPGCSTPERPTSTT